MPREVPRWHRGTLDRSLRDRIRTDRWRPLRPPGSSLNNTSVRITGDLRHAYPGSDGPVLGPWRRWRWRRVDRNRDGDERQGQGHHHRRRLWGAGAGGGGGAVGGGAGAAGGGAGSAAGGGAGSAAGGGA